MTLRLMAACSVLVAALVAQRCAVAGTVVGPHSPFLRLTKETPLLLCHVRDAVPQHRAYPDGKMALVGMSYRVTVLADLRGRLEEGAVVVIHGQTGLQGSNPPNIPVWEPATTLLICVSATTDPKTFEYEGADNWVAVGLGSVAVVPTGDVEPLRAAVRRLGTVIRDNNGIISTEGAIALLKEQNYYLWALGISAIASEQTKDAAEFLIRVYCSPETTLRQGFWLDIALHRFPQQARPSSAELHELMTRIVRRELENHR
jgi:hypothetical protein